MEEVSKMVSRAQSIQHKVKERQTHKLKIKYKKVIDLLLDD